MKKSCFESFNFITLEGQKITIEACYFETRTGWGHIAECFTDGAYYHKKINYYNRTWESFRFESVIKSLIWIMYPREKRDALARDFLLKQVNAISERKGEEADAWFNAFVKSYNALSDSTKQKIASSVVMLESKEQADALLKGAQLLDIMGAQ